MKAILLILTEGSSASCESIAAFASASLLLGVSIGASAEVLDYPSSPGLRSRLNLALALWRSDPAELHIRASVLHVFILNGLNRQ